jgi:single-strand DNA-binding protein
MNQAFLIGNLGRDPESKQTSNGKTLVNFSLATREGKDKTTWHNITAFDKTADIIMQYCKKGSKICVQGRISNRQYEQDGVNKIFSEVIANQIELLDKREDSSQAPTRTMVDKKEEYEDDIPF